MADHSNFALHHREKDYLYGIKDSVCRERNKIVKRKSSQGALSGSSNAGSSNSNKHLFISCLFRWSLWVQRVLPGFEVLNLVEYGRLPVEKILLIVARNRVTRFLVVSWNVKSKWTTRRIIFVVHNWTSTQVRQDYRFHRLLPVFFVI